MLHELRVKQSVEAKHAYREDVHLHVFLTFRRLTSTIFDVPHR